MITIVNIKQGELYDVYGGRNGDPLSVSPGLKGWLGNPYHMNNDRLSVIARHKQYFWDRVNDDDDFLYNVLTLRGKRVGCFCHPLPCHLDNVQEFLAWCETVKGQTWLRIHSDNLPSYK